MKKIIENNKIWDASFYNQYATPQFNIAQKALSQWKFDGHEDTLDIGCGNGAITSLIASKYLPKGFITGIDLSNDMINFAQKTFQAKNLEFKEMDACKISFEKNFDLIFSFYCLHWVKDQEVAFKKIADSLKNKGKSLLYLMTDSVDESYSITKFIKDITNLSKWKAYFQNYTLPWHFQTINSIEKIFNKVGLKLLEIELVKPEIVFPNKEAGNLWLKAVPIADQVSPELQYQLMNDLTENYYKYAKINPDGTIPFVLPTIKIIAQK